MFLPDCADIAELTQIHGSGANMRQEGHTRFQGRDQQTAQCEMKAQCCLHIGLSSQVAKWQTVSSRVVTCDHWQGCRWEESGSPTGREKVYGFPRHGNLLLWGTCKLPLKFPPGIYVQIGGNERLYQFHHTPSLQSLSILFCKALSHESWSMHVSATNGTYRGHQLRSPCKSESTWAVALTWREWGWTATSRQRKSSEATRNIWSSHLRIFAQGCVLGVHVYKRTLSFTTG